MSAEMIREMADAVAHRKLQNAFDAFSGNPGADQWNTLVRAMLVKQQLRALQRREGSCYLAVLEGAPLGEWDEQIVKMGTGRDIESVLRDHS